MLVKETEFSSTTDGLHYVNEVLQWVSFVLSWYYVEVKLLNLLALMVAEPAAFGPGAGCSKVG